MPETSLPLEIKPVGEADFEEMYLIINDAATAYRGIIPADRWHEPYMPREELRAGIADGIEFSGAYENGRLTGLMGIQDRGEVALIRHAYVRTVRRNAGIGGKLLEALCASCSKPILIGTWAEAVWAIRFYQTTPPKVCGRPARLGNQLRRGGFGSYHRGSSLNTTNEPDCRIQCRIDSQTFVGAVLSETRLHPDRRPRAQKPLAPPLLGRPRSPDRDLGGAGRFAAALLRDSLILWLRLLRL